MTEGSTNDLTTATHKRQVATEKIITSGGEPRTRTITQYLRYPRRSTRAIRGIQATSSQDTYSTATSTAASTATPSDELMIPPTVSLLQWKTNIIKATTQWHKLEKYWAKKDKGGEAKMCVRTKYLTSLGARKWVDDSVFYEYAKIFNKHIPTTGVLMFPPVITILLSQKNFDDRTFQNWIPTNVMNVKYILYIINTGTHWVIGKADMKTSVLSLIDSGRDRYPVSILEMAQRYTEHITDRTWTTAMDDLHVVQPNNYDCGICAISTAYHIAFETKTLDFDQKALKTARKQLLWYLYRRQIGDLATTGERTIQGINYDSRMTVSSVKRPKGVLPMTGGQRRPTLTYIFCNTYGSNGQWPERDWKTKLHDLSMYEPDIIGWAETNKDWSKNGLEERFRHTTKQHYRNTNCTAATTHAMIPNQSEYQPGGVAAIVAPTVNSRVSEVTADSYGCGRWITVTMKGKENKKLHIVQAYRPIKSTTMNATYVQQRRKLRASGITECPQKAFFRHLRQHVIRLSKDGQIVLGLDANCRNNTETWKNWMNSLPLVDVMEKFYDTPEKTTKSTTIDYILATPTLNITQGEVLPPDTIDSDHRPIMISIDMKGTLGKTPCVKDRKHRRLNSKNTRIAKKYMNDITKILKARGWNPGEPTDLQDEILQEACMQAESGLPLLPSNQWSAHLQSIITAMKDMRKCMKECHRMKDWEMRKILKAQYNDMVRKLRQATRESDELRRLHLYRLRQRALHRGDTKHARKLHRMALHEQRTNTYRKIRVVSKDPPATISTIEAPYQGGSLCSSIDDASPVVWKSYNVAEEIHSILIERNKLHFCQAEGTPMDGRATESVVAEAQMPRIARKLVHLQPWSLQPEKYVIEEEEVIRYLLKWRESTNTSPT
mgnify:CR=1 FL=1